MRKSLFSGRVLCGAAVCFSESITGVCALLRIRALCPRSFVLRPHAKGIVGAGRHDELALRIKEHGLRGRVVSLQVAEVVARVEVEETHHAAAAQRDRER